MKFIKFLSVFFVMLLASCSSTKNQNFLVGTYTENANQGINYIQFNPENNELKSLAIVPRIENPSFVISNKAKTIVVAVEETASDNGGKVTSYAFNSKTNAFQKLTSFFTKGNHPCTAAFSPNEDFVLVGNYSGGNLSVFPIDKQGNLSDNPQFIQYEGKSINVDRQEKPHVHCIVFHPKEDKIFVADLGTDAIKIIPFDSNSKTFLQTSKTTSTQVKAGSGPRHLVFDKSGSKLYATLELTNEVGVFDYKNGQLTLVQTIALTKPTKSGSSAELRLSKDGKFLYASVRGNDNQIVVMKTNDGSNLEVVQTVPTAKMPRNFILSENQKKVLVATQASSLISVFDRDEKTGFLTATSSELKVDKPVYLFSF